MYRSQLVGGGGERPIKFQGGRFRVNCIYIYEEHSLILIPESITWKMLSVLRLELPDNSR